MARFIDEVTDKAQRLSYVRQAWANSINYVWDSITRHCGADFMDIVRAIVPALMAAALFLVLTTLAGAGIGALFGGVGAGPGAAIGLRVGLFLLNWLGIGMLFVYVVEHLNEVGDCLGNGIKAAWDSGGSVMQIDYAARQIAEAFGIFFSLLLQALVLYLCKAAEEGKLTSVMNTLRESRLFRWCAGLEAWIRNNLLRLAWRYQAKFPIVRSFIKACVVTGGRIGPSKFGASLQEARALLSGMMSGDSPRFRNFKELHEYMLEKGLKPTKADMYGPRDPALPAGADPANPKGLMRDGAQIIYSSSDGTVVVKVKTRGYPTMRTGGTMSVEITNGGPEWADALCKLDRNGNPIAKTILAQKDVVVLDDGVYAITKGAQDKLAAGADMKSLTKGGFGNDLRKIVEFEVMEGGGVKPRNQDEFANLGHIDFQNFDPTGAWEILADLLKR